MSCDPATAHHLHPDARSGCRELWAGDGPLACIQSVGGDAEEHTGERSYHLPDDLRPRAHAQQMRRFKILHEVSRLHGAGLRHRASHQIGDDVARGYEAEQQLHGVDQVKAAAQIAWRCLPCTNLRQLANAGDGI